MNRFLHSVRLRLTLWYAGVLALALALFALSVYVFVVRSLEASIDQALGSYGQQVNRTTGPASVKSVIDYRLSYPKPVGALLIETRQSQAKARKGSHARTDLAQQLRFAIREGREGCGEVPAPPGRKGSHPAPHRYCVKLFYDRMGRPVLGVEVVDSLSDVNKTLDHLRLALLLGIPFALLLAGAGGWILASRALQPAERIADMARSITATDLSRRIGLRRQDELGRLAGTFDDMIGRLERAFQEQRQLTADVSHELRSPLTVLEAQTTLALRRARSAEEYRQVLGSVQEEVERMSSMVNQLLMLARADAGEEVITLQPVSLLSVTEPVIDGMQALAGERGVFLRLVSQSDVWVNGDPARLRQLLINLLDNALRHTARGGQVSVALGRAEDRGMLSVADNGDGIAEEDLPHIFQRFYRGDRARRRGTGNSGLGLAIVKWIVEAHGGEVHVRSAVDRGTRFEVTLPLAAAPLAAVQAKS